VAGAVIVMVGRYTKNPPLVVVGRGFMLNSAPA